MRFKIVFFPLWRRDPVLELQNRSNLWAVVHSSIVFCNSVSADRRGMGCVKVAPCGSCIVSNVKSPAKVSSNECWNRDPMERQLNGAEQSSLQPSHFNWAEKTLDRCNWGAVSQHELKGVEMRRKEMKGKSKNGAKIWNKSSEVPDTLTEVCPSSYRQNLFLDPIALHFLNLEASATRLARVLLVLLHYLMLYIISYYIMLYYIILY